MDEQFKFDRNCGKECLNSKAVVGAVFNVHGAIFGVILDVSPPRTMGRIIDQTLPKNQLNNPT